jgi:hypothetical protein
MQVLCTAEHAGQRGSNFPMSRLGKNMICCSLCSTGRILLLVKRALKMNSFSILHHGITVARSNSRHTAGSSCWCCSTVYSRTTRRSGVKVASRASSVGHCSLQYRDQIVLNTQDLVTDLYSLRWVNDKKNNHNCDSPVTKLPNKFVLSHDCHYWDMFVTKSTDFAI